MTTASEPMMSLTAPMPDPFPLELAVLLKRVRHRSQITPLERVAQEVGPTAYAEMLPEFYEATMLISRGRIVGLPPGTYASLLNDVVSRRLGKRWRGHW